VNGTGVEAVKLAYADREKYLGDMDFKVSGTTEGITGVQLDLKIRGLHFDLIEKTLERARVARLFILGKMEEAIKSGIRTIFNILGPSRTPPRSELR
jgi:polyribonucleotide nucleotidyltransferase